MHDIEINMTEPNRGSCRIDGREISITRFDVHGGIDKNLEVVLTVVAKSFNKHRARVPTPDEIRAYFRV